MYRESDGPFRIATEAFPTPERLNHSTTRESVVTLIYNMKKVIAHTTISAQKRYGASYNWPSPF